MKTKRFGAAQLLAALLLISDVLMLVAGFLVAYWVRFGSGWFESPKGIPPLSDHVGLMVLSCVVWVSAFKWAGLYRRHRDRSVIDEFYTVLIAGLLSTAVVAAVAMLLHYQWLSRAMFALSTFLSVLLVSIGRAGVRWLQSKLWEKRRALTKVAVVGKREAAEDFARRLKEAMIGCDVVSVVALCDSPVAKDEPPTRVEKMVMQMKVALVEEAMVLAGTFSEQEMLHFLEACEREGIRMRLMLDVLDIIKFRGQFEEVLGAPSLLLSRVPLRGGGRLLKRATDILVAGVMLLLFAVPMLVIAAIIKLTSPGGVLFRQERIGQDGKVFNMLKFRTMKEGAEDETGPIWAKRSDPRCTPVGAVLRRLSLDELPQLFNVLKGEMSLVGPRPERPYFVEQFSNAVPRYMERHRVKAGITGWAQVNGLRGNTPIEERTKYDIYYVENWSLLLDLKILAKTAFEVLFHREAY